MIITYVKIKFKSRCSPCYILSSRGQRIKNITNIKQKKNYCKTRFLVSVFMLFLVQKLINPTNIWSNFMFGSFFEQDHLLTLIIFGVYAKRWPKCALISKQKLMQPKIWSMIFLFWLWLWEDLFIGRILSEKKHEEYGSKRKSCMQNLAKERKRLPVSYSTKSDFLQYIHPELVTKKQQKIGPRCLWFMNFPSQIFFNDINNVSKAAILKYNSL